MRLRECTCDLPQYYWDAVSECYRCTKCHGRKFKEESEEP